MSKIVRAVFEKKPKNPIFDHKKTKNPKFEIYFRKSGRATELTFWSPNFMQKNRKILGAVFHNFEIQTN